MLVKNQWFGEEIKEEIKNPRDKWKWKHDDSKPVGCSKNSSKRKVYTDTIPKVEKKKKNSAKQPNITPKRSWERRTAKPKVKKKEIIKITAEINKMERKISDRGHQWK